MLGVGIQLKNYLKKEDEAQFYHIYIYISFFLAISSGSMIFRGVSEGKGIGYISLWVIGVVVSIIMGINSIKQFKKRKSTK